MDANADSLHPRRSEPADLLAHGQREPLVDEHIARSRIQRQRTRLPFKRFIEGRQRFATGAIVTHRMHRTIPFEFAFAHIDFAVVVDREVADRASPSEFELFARFAFRAILLHEAFFPDIHRARRAHRHAPATHREFEQEPAFRVELHDTTMRLVHHIHIPTRRIDRQPTQQPRPSKLFMPKGTHEHTLARELLHTAVFKIERVHVARGLVDRDRTRSTPELPGAITFFTEPAIFAIGKRFRGTRRQRRRSGASTHKPNQPQRHPHARGHDHSEHQTPTSPGNNRHNDSSSRTEGDTPRSMNNHIPTRTKRHKRSA